MRFGNKFARVGYAVEDRARVPSVLKHWYLKRFVACENIQDRICGEPGFNLRLPVTEQQVHENPELADFFAGAAAEMLTGEGVGIVIPPPGFPAEFPPGLTVAEGRLIFAFLIMPAIKKALGMRGGKLKATEVLIIDGDPTLTDCLIENIYPYVNYLSVVSDGRDYSARAAEIFEDCGLNLCVSGKNRQVLESADLVINTSADGTRYDFYFKRGAFYFELGGGGEKFTELLRRRPDMTAADGISVFAGGGRANLQEFEAAFYSMCGEYRRICTAVSTASQTRNPSARPSQADRRARTGTIKGDAVERRFEKRLAREVIERMGALAPEVAGLTRMGKIID